MGIIEAIGKYDYSHASKATFNTYAHYWIRRNCQKYLREQSSLIRMPAWRQGKESYKFNFLALDDPERNYRQLIAEISHGHQKDDEVF